MTDYVVNRIIRLRTKDRYTIKEISHKVKLTISNIKALAELNRIMDNMYEKINNAKEKSTELKLKLKEDTKKLNELKDKRDSKNLKTQELISSLKELEL